MIVDKWNYSEIKTYRYFDNLPDLGSNVIVLTHTGTYYARYCRWDWSDASEIPYFDFLEGTSEDVIAWRYKDEG